MRYPNIFALIVVILGVAALVLLAIFLLWPSSPPPEPSSAPPPEKTREVTRETTIIKEPTRATEGTTSQQKTAPPTSSTTGEAPPPEGCSSGSVIYQADWSSDMAGWVGSSDWSHTDSMLTNDGSPGDLDRRIMAPCEPPTKDYTLEAQIQLVDPKCVFGRGRKEFGLIARATEQGGGVLGGFDCDKVKVASTQYNPSFALDRETLRSEPFTPGGGWHTYRLEVQSDQVRFFVDGGLVFNQATNRNLNGTKVGMFSHGAQTNVRSFKIERL